MEKENKLSPIERGARNSIIWHLHQSGFNVTSIANIMSMSVSSVSRTVQSRPDKVKLIDTVLWGIPLE